MAGRKVAYGILRLEERPCWEEHQTTRADIPRSDARCRRERSRSGLVRRERRRTARPARRSRILPPQPPCGGPRGPPHGTSVEASREHLPVGALRPRETQASGPGPRRRARVPSSFEPPGSVPGDRGRPSGPRDPPRARGGAPPEDAARNRPGRRQGPAGSRRDAGERGRTGEDPIPRQLETRALQRTGRCRDAEDRRHERPADAPNSRTEPDHVPHLRSRPRR